MIDSVAAAAAAAAAAAPALDATGRVVNPGDYSSSGQFEFDFSHCLMHV